MRAWAAAFAVLVLLTSCSATHQPTPKPTTAPTPRAEGYLAVQLLSTDPVSGQKFSLTVGTVDVVGPVITRHAVDATGGHSFALTPGQYSITSSVPGEAPGSHPIFGCPPAKTVTISNGDHAELDLTCNSDAG